MIVNLMLLRAQIILAVFLFLKIKKKETKKTTYNFIHWKRKRNTDSNCIICMNQLSRPNSSVAYEPLNGQTSVLPHGMDRIF
jgi:hypothetical protein